ncbi:hypothetical protein L6452_02217 [Arctium lappa]|uniref:Uncharacterized protein n=1 Tax=Arctium lappa TaxID=4217 RepID=A0ACB9FIX8_ARCLA|nr:hypothetical protein L6452_02217 [Arctium lappa]
MWFRPSFESQLYICAHPYEGSFFFKTLFLSDLETSTIYTSLNVSLTRFFQEAQLPVDSVSLKNLSRNSEDYLVIDLEVFPSGEPYFNSTGISGIGNAFSIQNFKPDDVNTYTFEAEIYHMPRHKASNTGIIIGSTVGCCVLVILLLLSVMYAFRQKGRAERATQQSRPFALWDPTSGSGGVPQLRNKILHL